jgi:signal transduction histidine kinase
VQNTIDNLSVLERMVNQVIEVSAIISNRFAIEASRFNLAQLLRDLVEEWKPTVLKRELELSLSLPSEEMWIEGDQHRLWQVFDHLLRNAYSYTLPGGSIDVYTALKDGCAVIYVQDTGVGIAQDEIDRVFERMYRGRSAEAGPTDARGLGLGLYLSQQIVEAHHGAIHLDSKLDYGTIVTVKMPVRQDRGHE